MSEMSDATSRSVVDDFVAVSGASRETAEQLLRACDGDISAALALFFDGGNPDDGGGNPGDGSGTPSPATNEDDSAGTAAAHGLPGGGDGGGGDLESTLGSILSNARKEQPADNSSAPQWGLGRYHSWQRIEPRAACTKSPQDVRPRGSSKPLFKTRESAHRSGFFARIVSTCRS